MKSEGGRGEVREGRIYRNINYSIINSSHLNYTYKITQTHTHTPSGFDTSTRTARASSSFSFKSNASNFTSSSPSPPLRREVKLLREGAEKGFPLDPSSFLMGAREGEGEGEEGKEEEEEEEEGGFASCFGRDVLAVRGLY